MNPNVAIIILTVVTIILIIIVNRLVGTISRRSESKTVACQWGILTGITAMIIIFVVAFWAIPGIARMITPNIINTGVKV